MPLTILLADDHALVREGLRARVDSQPDMRVVGEAADGREVLKLVERHRPDVVVMDASMPELNGVEAAARIRKFSSRTQVVVLVDRPSGEEIFHALKSGALGCVLKKSSGAVVLRAVREAHAGRRFICPGIQDLIPLGFVQGRRLPSRSPLESLSAREREVLQMVAEGSTSASIASLLFLSSKTVDTYRSRLMAKLGVRNLHSLIRFSLKHALTPE